MDAIARDRTFIDRHRDLGSTGAGDGDRRILARLIADTVAIAAAAREGGEGACAHDRAARLPLPSGSCHVWGGGRERTRALDAAFLNGTAAEVLDFQEVLLMGRNNGHAAVVIVPALLALTEERPDCVARLPGALRAAFLANIGLMAALGRGHRKGSIGFRTTSLGAPVAAALGGACLLGLDAAATRNAVAIAACALPSGLLAAMAPASGSYSSDKDLSVGWSASYAIDAVRMAEAGCDGPDGALTGPRGWLASYGFDTAEPEALEAVPEESGLRLYAIKRFPANFGCQAAIRCALELRMPVDRISGVEIRVKASSAASLSTRALPNPLAARFSLPYAVASTLLRGRCSLADFAPDALTSPQVRALMDRCTLVGDDEFEARHHRTGVFPGSLRIIDAADGRPQVAFHEGPWDGMTEARIDSAFAEKLESLVGEDRADGLLAVSAALADGQMPEDPGRILG